MKKNIILSGILAALILFSWAWSGPMKDWKTKSGTANNFLSQLNPVLIDSIEITKKDSSIILEKNSDRWKVAGTKDFYVSSANMDEMMSVLETMTKSKVEVVSKNKEKAGVYGISDFPVLKINQAGRNYEFLVGDYTGNFTGCYISFGDFVYRFNGNLTSVISKDDWRDKQIFSFSNDNVSSIRFQYGKTQFIVEKNNDTWSGISPVKFSVSKDKIDEVINVLADLKATSIPEQDFSKAGIEKNNLIIQVTGENLDKTIMVGDCNKEDICYAKRADSDNLYFITKAQKDSLTKRMSSLK